MKKIILTLLVLFFNTSYSQDYGFDYYLDHTFYLNNIDEVPKLKIGVLNNKGNIIKEAIFSDGVHNINGITNVMKDSIPGYLDKKFNLKLFPKFKKAFWNGKIGYAIDKNGTYALISMNGDFITEFKYKNLDQTSEKYISVSENGKIKFITTKGKSVFNDSIKTTAEGIYNSMAIYTKNNKFGLVHINGKIVTEPIYDEIHGSKDSKNWVVKNNRKCGIIDSNGHEVTPIVYDEINYYTGNEKKPIPAKKGDKFGYIYNSKEVIPFIYDEALPFKNGIARVKKDNKYHYIDIQNKLICSFQRDRGWNGKDYFSYDLSVFKLNGKYGYINKKGEVAIEPIYQKVNNFKEGIALVQKDDLFGFINPKGEIVIPIKYEILSDIYDGQIMFWIN